MSAISPPDSAGGSPAVVIFERRPFWAPELERQFQQEDIQVVACRSIDDVVERSASIARGMILLEWESDPKGCLRFLRRWLMRPTPPVFVATAAAELEWMVRELGAAHVIATTIAGHDLAVMCRRQWADKT